MAEATPLKVLILEDRVEDATLAARELQRAGYKVEWQRVEDEEGYRQQLDETVDVVLADFGLPRWDTLSALKLTQSTGWDIPFIVVTGSLGDERAAECIKQGAADYLLKDRLARLGQAVADALETRHLRTVAQEGARQAAIADLSRKALSQPDVSGLFQDAATAAIEALGADYAVVWELAPDDRLVAWAVAGLPRSLIGQLAAAAGEGSHCASELA